MMIKLKLSLIFLFVICGHIKSQTSKEIEKEAFKSYKSKSLDWANKQNPEEVEILFIDNFNAKDFPNADILKFRNLKKLIVHARPLVEKFNEEMKDPVELNIDENKLRQLVSLEFLQLSQFDFRTFPKELLVLENLQSLSLNNCLVESMPAEIIALKKLNGLFLRQNSLEELPENFSQLKSLKVLDLSNNSLTDIPIPLLKMETLEVVYLANYNGIKTDPFSWDWPVNLGVNVINYEDSNSVLTELLSLPKLKKIHLHVNNASVKKKVKVKLNNKTFEKKIYWQAIDCGCG